MPTVLTDNYAHKSYFTALPRKEKIRTTLPNVDKSINHLGRYVRLSRSMISNSTHRPPLIRHLQSNPALDTILVKKSWYTWPFLTISQFFHCNSKLTNGICQQVSSFAGWGIMSVCIMLYEIRWAVKSVVTQSGCSHGNWQCKPSFSETQVFRKIAFATQFSENVRISRTQLSWRARCLQEFHQYLICSTLKSQDVILYYWYSVLVALLLCVIIIQWIPWPRGSEHWLEIQWISRMRPSNVAARITNWLGASHDHS